MSLERDIKIVEAYKRGDKAIVIETEYKVSPGALYKILHDANVQLRSKDPTHPASSLKTRQEAGIFPKKEVVMVENNAEIIKRLDELDEKINGIDTAVGELLGYGNLEDGMKADIVDAFLKARLGIGDIELAKKIVNVVEAIDRV